MFFILEVFFTNLSWLPGYLIKERGYTVIKSGLYLALPMLPPLWSADRRISWGPHRASQRGCFGSAFLIARDDWRNAQSGYAITLLLSVLLIRLRAAFNALIVVIFDLFPAEVVGVAAGVLLVSSVGLAE